MKIEGGDDGKGGRKISRLKRIWRDRFISSLKLPAVFMWGLLLLSWQPKLLNGPGMWENFILSDWVPPHPHYPNLLKKCIARGLAEPENLWAKPPSDSWTACTTPSDGYSPPGEESQGYLQLWLEGGLNQQRIGVCNAVALARLLNVTLLLPELEMNPVWQDSSWFGEIFDVDFLIESLRGSVRIVRELPPELQWSTREFYKMPAHGEHQHVHTRVKNAPVHASPQWYLTHVLPIIAKYKIAAIAPFTHRLSFDGLPPDIQKLRCRVNFQYLRFVAPVEALGRTIVERLQAPELRLPGLPPGDGRHELAQRSRLAVSTEGQRQPEPAKFMALHLRFDKDMVAHSSCEFGGGWAEQRAMIKYRAFAWQNRIDKLQFTPDELRRAGRCPLTPEEIGLLLAALGFSNRTRLYLASYKVYGGEARMAPLREMFPLTVDKNALVSPEEIAPYLGKASLLAAIDFLVSVHSDIFVSASAGNMRNVVAGYRQFNGVMKTINPSLSKLAEGFSDPSHTWDKFKTFVINAHKRRIGQVVSRTARGSIYTYPAPDCMCQTSTSSIRNERPTGKGTG